MSGDNCLIKPASHRAMAASSGYKEGISIAITLSAPA
jgi:hypothetical protein